jgi:hypothetical protein
MAARNRRNEGTAEMAKKSKGKRRPRAKSGRFKKKR